MNLRHLLAIETSCDDSAAAILSGEGELLADVLHSQIQPHSPYGGVVPEIASRQHLGRIAGIVHKALADARLTPKQIDAVAVTFGPGLVGSLLVGAEFAKGFAQALGVPLIAIHHIEGHLMASLGTSPDLKPPFISLIVSGGHSALYLCDTQHNYETLGETRDDAAGEAFDKIGRMLGLSYPAGRVIDELADKGNPKAYAFPVALRAHTTLDYSFSGLKTAARLALEKKTAEGVEMKGQSLWDFCASVRSAIVEALLAKAILACRQRQVTHLVLGGGVAANSLLRSEAIRRGAENDLQVHLPPKNHCVDNAVMIARAGLRRLQLGQTTPLTFDVRASVGIEDLDA